MSNYLVLDELNKLVEDSAAKLVVTGTVPPPPLGALTGFRGYCGGDHYVHYWVVLWDSDGSDSYEIWLNGDLIATIADPIYGAYCSENDPIAVTVVSSNGNTSTLAPFLFPVTLLSTSASDSVSGATTTPVAFTVTKQIKITDLAGYHYPGGSDGSFIVTNTDTSTVVATLPATYHSDYTTTWDDLNTGLLLPAGNYSVRDTGANWSVSSGSGGRGMINILGIYA